MRPRNTRFNTPAEMLVRLVFVSRYVFCIAGFMMMLSAFGLGSILDGLKAVIFFGAMWAGHSWLKRNDKLTECENAFAAMAGEARDTEDELEQLLARREELEHHRGEPGFDPWAVQALRREISDYVRTHPESSRRFDGRL
jgi:hypothetical protein